MWSRLLRALRAIKHVEQLRVIVDVLVGCVPSVMAALAIVLIIYTCFGILGLSLFGGMFYRCDCAPSAPDTCSEDEAVAMCIRMFYGLDSDYHDVVHAPTGLVRPMEANATAEPLPFQVPPKEVCLSVCLSACVSACLPVCLFVWLPVCLSDCVSVCSGSIRAATATMA